MGHGQSKKIGSDERGVRLYCRLDGSMTTSVVVPDDVASRYCLQFEKWVGLMDSKKGVYCCHVEQVGVKTHLTKGWSGFLAATGATIGDLMLFDIRGADETQVWVYPCADERAATAEAGSSMAGGNTNCPAVQTATNGIPAVDNTTRESGTTDNGVSGDLGTGADDMSDVLAAWRDKFVVGRNVDLEDWMIEYVATGLDWEMPKFSIYVGKVEGTSLMSNRMRLPKTYTTDHVMPLLKWKQKSFTMDSGVEGGKQLKFNIGQDGRATLTHGWNEFAVSNGIRPGSVLAFCFSNKHTELDISIDLLQE